MRKGLFLPFLFLFCIGLYAQQKEIRLKILQTSDIHGNYFPYDFILEKPAKGSLSRVATYLKQEREKYGQRLILLDNGDILQGQPAAYYYNFVDTTSVHLCARMLNYMGYEAGAVGNHDIETGNKVYDRFVRQSDFPWLAANALLDKGDGTYFKPYRLIEKDGIRIAILGMITPAIPVWLPKNLWPDMHFADVRTTVQQWIPYLKEKEHADIIIGLFHLGMNSQLVANGMDEGGGLDIAREIPGLDVVMLGHDHRPDAKHIANVKGDSVWIVNPGANGVYLSEIEISIAKEKDQITKKQLSGRLVNLSDVNPDPEFLARFQPDFEKVRAFVAEKVGTFTGTMHSRDAYFGPSAFVDFIHRVQLDITGADVSFAAPLSYDIRIEEGDILVSDLFKLYKYENFLYTMTLSGKEIKGFLESCYGIWVNRMQSPEDHLLRIEKDKKNEYKFVYPSYNFDSAAGISYTVDVTKPEGERITIASRMANGKVFDMDKQYTVAVNSYRGNGGGDHLTKGSGIPHEQLPLRIQMATPVDLRYYMMEWIKKKQTIQPEIISDWKLIPETWTGPAGKRDYQLLFNP